MNEFIALSYSENPNKTRKHRDIMTLPENIHLLNLLSETKTNLVNHKNIQLSNHAQEVSINLCNWNKVASH